MRTEHRTHLAGKLISMDQNSMTKLLMETDYEKSHLHTLETPDGADSIPMTTNSLSKVSPAKKRNHNPSMTE